MNGPKTQEQENEERKATWERLRQELEQLPADQQEKEISRGKREEDMRDRMIRIQRDRKRRQGLWTNTEK